MAEPVSCVADNRVRAHVRCRLHDVLGIGRSRSGHHCAGEGRSTVLPRCAEAETGHSRPRRLLHARPISPLHPLRHPRHSGLSALLERRWLPAGGAAARVDIVVGCCGGVGGSSVWYAAACRADEERRVAAVDQLWLQRPLPNGFCSSAFFARVLTIPSRSIHTEWTKRRPPCSTVACCSITEPVERQLFLSVKHR